MAEYPRFPVDDQIRFARANPEGAGMSPDDSAIHLEGSGACYTNRDMKTTWLRSGTSQTRPLE
jgi:hypothetical protein